jgi:hypothetical protein
MKYRCDICFRNMDNDDNYYLDTFGLNSERACESCFFLYSDEVQYGDLD